MPGTACIYPSPRLLPLDQSIATIDHLVAVVGGHLPYSRDKRAPEPRESVAKRHKGQPDGMAFESLLGGKTPKSALYEYFQLQVMIRNAY